jgi:hypothetical protein
MDPFLRRLNLFLSNEAPVFLADVGDCLHNANMMHTKRGQPTRGEGSSWVYNLTINKLVGYELSGGSDYFPFCKQRKCDIYIFFCK